MICVNIIMLITSTMLIANHNVNNINNVIVLIIMLIISIIFTVLIINRSLRLEVDDNDQ